MKPTTPITAALRIGLFSFIIVGMVSLVFNATKDKIAANEHQALLDSLQSVLNQSSYDNDLANDVMQLQGYTIYRARKSGAPVAAILSSTTPHGYNGDISLLIGIDISGKISGVRVLKHRETPGLGGRQTRARSVPRSTGDGPGSGRRRSVAAGSDDQTLPRMARTASPARRHPSTGEGRKETGNRT